MGRNRLRCFNACWTTLLVVIVFVCPSCSARSRQQLRTRYAAAHSYQQHHPSIPSLRRIAKKDDPTPVPSPSPSARPSMATVPLTASSFGVVSPSPSAPSPSTVRGNNPTIVPSANPLPLVAETIIEETADVVVPRSKNGRRRKKRLVAILVPISTVSFLLLAFLLLLFVRKRRRGAVNETYAELGSNGSSSSVGTPGGDNATPEEPVTISTTNDAAQFVFPLAVPSRKARQRKDSDSIVMQVERIEIAGVGDVVPDGVHVLSTTTAGALQLTVAYKASQIANNNGTGGGVKDGGDEETTSSSGGWSDLTGESSSSVTGANKQRDSKSRNIGETSSRVRITGLQGIVNDRDIPGEEKDPQCKHIITTAWNSAPRIRNQVDPDRTVSENYSSSTVSPINGEKEWLEWKYRGENNSESPELKLSETTETETSSSICS